MYNLPKEYRAMLQRKICQVAKDCGSGGIIELSREGVIKIIFSYPDRRTEHWRFGTLDEIKRARAEEERMKRTLRKSQLETNLS